MEQTTMILYATGQFMYNRLQNFSSFPPILLCKHPEQPYGYFTQFDQYVRYNIIYKNLFRVS